MMGYPLRVSLMKTEPPTLSIFQICVLNEMLGEEDIKGEKLRTLLRKQGYCKSASGFNESMRRLERASLVEGWYVQDVVNGYTVNEKFFRITGEGKKEIQRAVQFLEKTLIFKPA